MAGFLSYRHTGLPADAVHTRNALHQLAEHVRTSTAPSASCSNPMLAAAGFEIVDAAGALINTTH